VLRLVAPRADAPCAPAHGDVGHIPAPGSDVRAA